MDIHGDYFNQSEDEEDEEFDDASENSVASYTNKMIGAQGDQNYDLDIIFGNNFIQFFLLFHHLFF